MAATTVIARGSSATTTGSTWATTTNAYDGTAGTNTNTYATVTAVASGTTPTIKVSGYGFSSTLNSQMDVNSVTVTARGLVTTANKWSAPTVGAYVGATLVSNTATLTAWTTTVASYTATLTGVTIDELLDSTFGIQLNLIRTGNQTDGASVDFLDVTVNYSYKGWGSLDLHS